MEYMENTWSRTECKCIYCDEVDFTYNFGPRLMILCSCCVDNGAHIECDKRAKNAVLTEEVVSEIDWQCSEV
jgi:hypothetical protein